MSTLAAPFFTTSAMAAIFAADAQLAALLRVEAALAKAQEACGVIPPGVAAEISKLGPSAIDHAALTAGLMRGGNLAIPLVKQLQEKLPADAARFVHWGATSQDIIDTALVLQMAEALHLIEAELHLLRDRLAVLADSHVRDPMVGRTLLQQAVPTTLGLKIAGWLAALDRDAARLDDARPRLLTLQLGGAAGTLASLGDKGPPVADAMAANLELSNPPLPWHGTRDRIAEAGSLLALLIGSLAKMARDFALMAQTEIAEAFEGDAGGSSAMPHKANPVSCARILACHARAPNLSATLIAAMDQEHERALGGWHAEWEVLPDLFALAAASLEAARTLADHGRFDTIRMVGNLEMTGGLVMAEAVSLALAQKIGKAEAHRTLETAAKRSLSENMSLRSVLEMMPETSGLDLDALFAPRRYLGSAPRFVADQLAARKRHV
ncbi:3-carboxy-cis,cis-muconate cycloisomerase [Lacibacterium aquatile]|uniref:3-carboxy-cis,cis-muconate cycloisomerase n=1 Tax=Lacibacterium aquatile TaxID=1168082 RepID=A0ABW5DLT9_9PROT